MTSRVGKSNGSRFLYRTQISPEVPLSIGDTESRTLDISGNGFLFLERRKIQTFPGYSAAGRITRYNQMHYPTPTLML
jgi:hypothetical protein